MKAVAAAVRSGEWWDHKLVPLLTAFYATALFAGAGVSALWTTALVFLLSLLPGAAYVSIVNDVFDVRSDEAAGKPNRMAARSPAFRAAAVAACVAAGFPFFWYWRSDPAALACYAAAWIAFSLYSVPPARLKVRGVFGLCADAAGAHFFPTLLAAAALFAALGRPAPAAWLAAIGCWSFALGCRGILWHQLLDRDRDERSGIATFAVRHPPAATARLAAIIFAAELAALAAMLLMMGSLLALAAGLYYLLLVHRRARIWGLGTVIAAPRAEYRIWLDDYYGVLLPVSVLAASAIARPADLLVLLAHILLFPRRPMETVRDSWILVAVPLFNRLMRRRPMDRRPPAR
ncbi:MAG TPA: UbiA family prenyltransferase [Allosphingosinicella sp.]|nr:UbiA family prenyltransferase [Allosphingosinicella sp.]